MTDMENTDAVPPVEDCCLSDGEKSGTLDDVNTLKPKKLLSRQGRMYRERRKNGLCPACGKPAIAGSAQCEKHQKKERKRKRLTEGCKPRKENGRGRPPHS